MTNEEDLEVGSITIRQILTDSDSLVGVEFSDDLEVMEMLGMLELAKVAILEADNSGD